MRVIDWIGFSMVGVLVLVVVLALVVVVMHR